MAYKINNTIKCVVVGDSAVDKTSLLVAYTSIRFPTIYVPTVFENTTSTLIVDNKTYNLGLFDTAGQEDFDQLRQLAYTDTDVFLICYSVKSTSSFKNVKLKWAPEIIECCPGTPFLLVGTNIDQLEVTELVEDCLNGKLFAVQNSDVSFEEGEKLAEELSAVRYMECSAVTQEGLNEIFVEAVRAALRARDINRKKERFLYKTKMSLKKCVNRYVKL